MNKTVVKNLRPILILTLISGILWIGYIVVRIIQPLPADVFAGKTIEPLNLELQIDIAEEL